MSKGKTTTVQDTSLPAFQEAQFKELFSRARGLSQQPFIPYTGPMVAGFNPDQLRQFQATRGLFESGMAFDPTQALQGLAQQQRPMTGQVGSLLTAPIEQYQSPFQQQVIDQALGDIQRQADIARGGAQDRAIRAGAFGGSRSALLESESQRPFIEAQARTAANLRQAGFEQAQRAAERDLARQQQLAMFAPQLELRARQQQAGLLGGLQGSQLQNLGLLSGIGQQQQLLQQAGIDAARGEFQRALGYGPQQLGLLQAGIGIPLTTTTTTGKQKTGLGDVLGTGAELLGTAMTAGLISDVRLKTNINYIGMSEQGHKLYTWEWNEKAKNIGIDSPTFGVLAQEVMKYKPSAVSQREDGYYIVNYKEL
jgi:hypothetical protein